MQCPHCQSTNIQAARYGAIPGGGRRAVVAVCRRCHAAFDLSRVVGPRRRIHLPRAA